MKNAIRSRISKVPTLKACRAKADMFQRATERHWKRMERIWRRDPEMLEMYIQDRADLNKITSYIQVGNLDRAYEVLCDLDTAARDVCPMSVWNFVEAAAEE